MLELLSSFAPKSKGTEYDDKECHRLKSTMLIDVRTTIFVDPQDSVRGSRSTTRHPRATEASSKVEAARGHSLGSPYRARRSEMFFLEMTRNRAHAFPRKNGHEPSSKVGKQRSRGRSTSTSRASPKFARTRNSSQRLSA